MSVFGLQEVYAFVLATVLIVIMPGPNSLYVFSLAIQKNKKKAFWGAAGIFFGDGTLLLLSSIGGASFLFFYPSIFLGLKIIGACYLSWIGSKLIIKAFRLWKEEKIANKAVFTPEALPLQHRHKSSFIKAYYISLLNPKAIIFIFSFFIQFIDPNYPQKFVPFIFGSIIVQIISVLYLTILINIANFLAEKIATKSKVQAFFQLIIGLLLCIFGILMIFNAS